MAGIELCKFTHGLGLYILRFYPSLPLRVKFEYKGPSPCVNLHNSMPVMNYFLNNIKVYYCVMKKTVIGNSTSHRKRHKKTTIYNVRIPGFCLGQAQK